MLAVRLLRSAGVGAAALLLGFAQQQLDLPLPERLSSLALWSIAALLGWLLGRQGERTSVLDTERQAVFWPLWTLLISSALFAAVGRVSSLPMVLAVHGLWLLYVLGWQVLAQHLQPPLRVGVDWTMKEQAGTGADHSPLVADRRVTYVTLSEQTARRLSDVDVVLVQPELTHFAEHRRILRHAQITKVPTWSKVLLDEELTGKVSLELINRDWLDAAAFHSRYLPFKRAFDVLATLLSLPLLLPLVLVVALLVRIYNGSPVLFWQERVGKDGQTFKIAKFRTMTTDSERFGPAFAERSDPRVTPLGSFLRKFRLDELPQFWNVLRGEMSIIGPRPEQWAFAADFEESIPLYACRHWVRPGITGWAQVNQGYTDSLGQAVEKLEYDFYYVKNLSFVLDIMIVGKTIHTILNGFGSR